MNRFFYIAKKPTKIQNRLKNLIDEILSFKIKYTNFYIIEKDNIKVNEEFTIDCVGRTTSVICIPDGEINGTSYVETKIRKGVDDYKFAKVFLQNVKDVLSKEEFNIFINYYFVDKTIEERIKLIKYKKSKYYEILKTINYKLCTKFVLMNYDEAGEILPTDAVENILKSWGKEYIHLYHTYKT